MPKTNRPEDIWRFIDRRGPTECWNWTAKRSRDGYGQFSMNYRSWRAHRIAWELANAKGIPNGLIVLHACDNPSCCNPAHLSLGTHQDNFDDSARKGRRSSHLVKSALGEEHHSHKLTAEDVRSIRGAGLSQKELAEKYGVSQSSIWAIIHRKNWAHVP